MRRLLAAAALALVQPARAGEPGPSIALRTGWAIPIGDAVAGARLSTSVGTQIPFWVDLAWRFDDRLAAGLFGQVGIATAGMGCASGASCSAYVLRVGAEILYRFLPGAAFRPWAGAGAGYETARARSALSGLETHTTFKGWEVLILQGGGDWSLAPGFAVGPWAALSVGRYLSQETVTPLQTQPDVSGKATHLWLQLGLKGGFDF